ncbi:hypothetical protein PAPYR_6660 [Paratrimastix pyriformis]|uniref:Uncharacterized protein n=1 Tax=Paratrimastix pyriformis TaxID=342808 RepID=A0ABQ8UEM0_9EUKA|nr:hypothetical protein PAPYR_6660 [Paratrimastix pyriformis]
MFALRVWAYRQEVCALGSEQAVRRPAPQTIEQIVRNALRTNLGNNELEMLIYCFIIGAMSTSVLDSPAPGQALAPGSADPVAAVAPAPLVPSPVVGGAAEAVRPDGPEALFAAWKRQRTSTTNVGVTPCGRSLVLEVRGPVERAVTRPVKVPVRSASREVEVRWRLAPSAAKKTEDLGWRSGRSEMELEVALQAALDEGTIADASAVKWDSGMVFAAPADLVSLKGLIIPLPLAHCFEDSGSVPDGKREKARPAFIGGKALQRSWPRPAPGDVADAVSAGDADSGHAGDGAGYAARGWGGEECPGEKGTAAAKTASATDTAKSKKRKPSPSGERRSSHSHHHTHAHGHGSSHR